MKKITALHSNIFISVYQYQQSSVLFIDVRPIFIIIKKQQDDFSCRFFIYLKEPLRLITITD